MKKVFRVLLKNPDSYELMTSEEQDKIKRLLCTLPSDKIKEILDNLPVDRGYDFFSVVVRYYAESLTFNKFQIENIIENISYERAVKFMSSQNFNPYRNITMNNQNNFKRIRRIGDENDKY